MSIKNNFKAMFKIFLLFIAVKAKLSPTQSTKAKVMDDQSILPKISMVKSGKLKAPMIFIRLFISLLAG
ncbi:hypothetical protein [Marinicella rhabdoformis]|uniref:hypothetical protein n=1 Tax=Marinicella rhabdoformis TaxID=2580566 RepID=UPI001C5561B5|nr:hypothetical protein [Marinicella rhabdoformis]